MQPEHRSTFQLKRILALWVIGLMLSTVLAAWIYSSNQKFISAAVQQATHQLVTQLIDRILSYERGLRGARGVIVAGAQEHMRLEAFRTYMATRDIDTEFPGARGFGFIQRVPVAEQGAFLQDARRFIDPQFSIKQLEPHASERYVIKFIEPLARNRSALGLDIASDVARREAALVALHNGAATLTAPITLIQAAGYGEQGFLLLLPTYRPHMPLNSAQQREAATFGWVYTPLVFEQIWQQMGVGKADLVLRIQDVTGSVHNGYFFSTDGRSDATPGRHQTQLVKVVFGRQWTFSAEPTPAFIGKLKLIAATTVFFSCALTTLLLATLVVTVYGGRHSLRYLNIQKKILNSIIENSTDAILIEAVDGDVISLNQRAVALYGYSQTEAVGKNLSQLIVRPAVDSEKVNLLLRQEDDLHIKTFDAVHKRKDGTFIDVTVTVIPIRNADNVLMAVAKIVRDVSATKQAERALMDANSNMEQAVQLRNLQLAATQRNLQNVIDAMPSTIGYWDKHLINGFANLAYHHWYGMEPTTLPGKHLRDVLGEELFLLNKPYINAVLRGEPQTFERTLTHRSTGQTSHTLTFYIPDVVDGTVQGFYALAHDITELTASKQALAEVVRENQALLQTMHQHSLVSIADKYGKIIEVNDAFCALSGYSREELLGQDHRIVNSKHHPKKFWRDLWRTLARGVAWRGEICNRAQDGSLYWVDSIIAPFYDGSGRITKYISIRHDITAIKTAQQRLLESETFLTQASQVTKVGGFVLDLRLGQVTWSKEAYAIFDLDPEVSQQEDVLGRFLTPEQHQKIRDVINITREQGTRFNIEVPMTTARGRHIWVHAVGEPVVKHGLTVSVTGAMQDVTERHVMEEQLRSAMVHAEKANHAKSEFLANMSHEIRTPLNAVIGLGYLLEQTVLNAEQQSLLTKIQFAGRALLSIINNVLDLSKIEAGEMTLEVVPCDLLQLQQEIYQLLLPQAQKKHIELRLCPTASIPECVACDVTRLRQMLLNLLNNAIKFTDKGYVELHTEVMEADQTTAWLRFEIRDTGVGITPEIKEKLFMPFSQADSSTTRRFGGTGLGLSITRRFVELMGGSIGVESTMGVGSVFWMELPLQLESIATVQTDTKLSMLVAEPVVDTPQSLSQVVQMLGWHAHTVTTGAALLVWLQDQPTEAWPAAILLDTRLSDMTIVQLLQRLTEKFSQLVLPPKIIVRPAVDTHLPADLPVDMVLTQPVNSSVLFNAVNTVIAHHEQNMDKMLLSTHVGGQAVQWLPGVRIVVADDSEINLEVAKRILERQGAQVITCTEGAAAVAYLATQIEPTDIVLMDIQMPVMDGNTAANCIRHDLHLTELPIIALTAGALVSERQRAMESGMNDFLTKPFEPQVLIRTVRRYVEQVRGSKLPIHIAGERLAEQAVLPELSSIDYAMAQRMFGQDRSLFIRALNRMLREHAEFALPIAVQDSAEDYRQLRMRVHKLKGSAGMVGAMAVYRLADVTEQALDQHDSVAAVEALFGQLAAALTTLSEDAQPLLTSTHLTSIPQSTATAIAATAVIPTVSAEKVNKLLTLLDAQDLAAVEYFAHLSTALRPMLNAQQFEAVQGAVENLDFQEAAGLLRSASLSTQTATGT